MLKNKGLSEKAEELFMDMEANKSVDTTYIAGHLPDPLPLQNIYDIEKDANGEDFAKRVNAKKLLNALEEVSTAKNIESKLIQGSQAFNNISSAKSELSVNGYGFHYGNYAVDLTQANVPASVMLLGMKAALQNAHVPTKINPYLKGNNLKDEQSAAELLDTDRM